MTPGRQGRRRNETVIARPLRSDPTSPRPAGDGHAGVHGARAGAGRGRAGRRTGRRLRAGLDPVRDPDRAAGICGRSAGEIHRKAARGDLADAMAGWSQRGRRRLIAWPWTAWPEAEDRPRDAGVVAQRMTAYRPGCRTGCAPPRSPAPPRKLGPRKRRSGGCWPTSWREAEARAEESRRPRKWPRPRPRPRPGAAVDRCAGRGAAGPGGGAGGGYACFRGNGRATGARWTALRDAEVLRGEQQAAATWPAGCARGAATPSSGSWRRARPADSRASHRHWCSR